MFIKGGHSILRMIGGGGHCVLRMTGERGGAIRVE